MVVVELPLALNGVEPTMPLELPQPWAVAIVDLFAAPPPKQIKLSDPASSIGGALFACAIGG